MRHEWEVVAVLTPLLHIVVGAVSGLLRERLAGDEDAYVDRTNVFHVAVSPSPYSIDLIPRSWCRLFLSPTPTAYPL